MEEIKKYFPHLSQLQFSQIESLYSIYNEWNQKINVISRKDMPNFYIHHVLHSLAIAYSFKFKTGSTILDVGTGGGFPGIPLAILFPECNFTLVDSIGKKIKVVEAVTEALDLKNVTAMNCRAENLNSSFDFIVSRAVTNFPEFYNWVKNKISKKHNNEFPNGIIYLKGGDIDNEIKRFGNRVTIIPISEYFPQPFFETKVIVQLKF
jgi:16S rRNA (guanine527-N7)-methyltransferase